MASFTIGEVLKAVGGVLVRRGNAGLCRGVSTDTRTLEEGNLFIPLSGEHFDGHRFLSSAAEKGAAAVVVSNREAADNLPPAVTVIAAGDTLRALEDLARFHRQRFSVPVVAVTGSNGKTTTKDMISAVLKTTYRVCHTKKNFNNEIGLSQTLLSLTEDDEVCVVEMGMRGLGQIAELCRIACPTLGVVTNVGTSHIGILGSRENIARAKGELIDALPVGGTAILNEDDDFVRAMGDRYAGRVVSYGVAHGKDARAEHVEQLPEAMDFQCSLFGETFPVHLPMIGIHNVYDALAAAAAGRVLGVSAERIRQALECFRPQGDSQKIETVGGVRVLNDSYNANPLSMEMAFRAFAQMEGRRHILVLGDMLELGRYEEEFHRDMGRRAAEMGFDAMITVGPLAKLMADAARQAGMADTVSFSDCRSAAAYIRTYAEAGDAVLIKGSHAMHLETIPGLWRGEAE